MSRKAGAHAWASLSRRAPVSSTKVAQACCAGLAGLAGGWPCRGRRGMGSREGLRAASEAKKVASASVIEGRRQLTPQGSAAFSKRNNQKCYNSRRRIDNYNAILERIFASMSPEIASLSAAINFWEGWGYVALAAVFIVVVGESIEEFTDWPKKSGFDKRLTRLSLLLLIAGLAGEIITQPNTNMANDRFVALLNRETGQLALQLEQEINKRASRTVTDKQMSSLVAELSKIGGPYFLVCRNEDEPRQYCDRFSIALTKAHLINDNVAPPVFTNDPGDDWTGIKLYTPTISDRGNPQNDPFAKAFEMADIPLCGICYETLSCQLICHRGVIINAGPSGNGVVRSTALGRPMRSIYIGQKPLPD
jgi:hypothetical protein